MDYEKKYNEALERANMIYNDKYKPEIAAFAKKSLETIFPELEAYEDERRRKAIHIYLDWLDGRKDCAPRGEYSIRDMIAWLEKQGEQNSVDKVEPKFHEGEWIISNNKKSTYQVIEVKRGIYVIRDNVDNHEYHIGIEEAHKSGRLWTIKDAKDGDYLTVNGIPFIYCCCDDYLGNYCCIDPNGEFRTTFNFGSNGKTILPATKEQRDELEKAITNAGYRWDKEKLKLEKI